MSMSYQQCLASVGASLIDVEVPVYEMTKEGEEPFKIYGETNARNYIHQDYVATFLGYETIQA